MVFCTPTVAHAVGREIPLPNGSGWSPGSGLRQRAACSSAGVLLPSGSLKCSAGGRLHHGVSDSKQRKGGKQALLPKECTYVQRDLYAEQGVLQTRS
jgi:hypothetical protein